MIYQERGRINGDLDKAYRCCGFALSQWCWGDPRNNHILAVLLSKYCQLLPISFNFDFFVTKTNLCFYQLLLVTLRDESLFKVESDTLAFFFPYRSTWKKVSMM